MNNVYNSYFFNEFYQENGGGNYTDEKLWTPFFEMIADKIVELFAPRTVLDAGCACGYLVAALRDRGVEAFGIDISEYAIGKARKDIRPYLNVQSVTDKLPKGFPEKFDLAVTIEVLEHLFPEEGKKAIELLCSYSDTVVFTSTPTDIEDKTHVNVQQREYWVELFARNSFYRDLVTKVDFICAHAMLFKRGEDIAKVLFEYELSNRVEELKNKKEDNVKESQNGCIYFDCGSGYSEENKAIFNYQGSQIKTERILLPRDCQAIRIDVLEEAFCMVKDIFVGSDRGSISISDTNSSLVVEDVYYFSTMDPQIICNIADKNICWIEVSANILIMSGSHELEMVEKLCSHSEKKWEKHASMFKVEKEKDMELLKEKELEKKELDLKYANELFEHKKQHEIEKAEAEREKRQLENLLEEQKKLFEIERKEIQLENERTLFGYQKECEQEKKKLREEVSKEQKEFFEIQLDKQRAEYEKNLSLCKSWCEEEIEKVNEKRNELEQQLKEEKENLLLVEKTCDEKLHVSETEKSELRSAIEKLENEVEDLQKSGTEKLLEYESRYKSQICALEEQKKELETFLQEIENECEEMKKEMAASMTKERELKEKEYKRLLEAERMRFSECENAYMEQLQQMKNGNEELAVALNSYKQCYEGELNQSAALKMQLEYYMQSFNQISNSQFWKMTAPCRKIIDLMKKILKSNKVTYLFCKGLISLKNDGVRKTWEKVKLRKAQQKNRKQYAREEQQVIESIQPVEYVAGTEMSGIKFSILVPLYNTPEKFLCEMIESVMRQTYGNWELCLADGSDSAHYYVETVVKELQTIDGRIKYARLEQNLGISENTNNCAKMATGDYIGFLDHDDLLAPNALYENAKAISETMADVLYSDEDHLSMQGEHVNPFFKPDWSPDLLYSQMYICHFTVVRRELFEALGGFRSAFDGSQDYDLLLRLSEVTDRICHIPCVLYTWRECEGSTAANADAKPYAHTAGRNALDSHLKRKYGSIAHAEDSEYTFVFEPRFDYMQNTPLVSIIIPMKDKWELTDACIQSILTKSTYQNYEIIILDNRSEEKKTKEWFKRIRKQDKRIRVVLADMEFNWSKLNNFGIAQSNGEVYIFLNNDTLIITPDWMERLCENALREDIGVVGALLLYEDDTIQHAGVVVGFGGWADHVFKGMSPIHYGAPFVSPMVSRNVLAVTGACMAISKRTIETIGLFDEEFIICGSDVEMCVRAYERGLFNRYDANVRLYHLESKSRDSYIPEIDFQKSYECYTPYRENIDPFFNVNLDINSVVPREKKADMNLINFKNFLKRCPLAVKAYHAVKRAIMEPQTYNIPEIGPIRARQTEFAGAEIRMNLLVPSVDKQHVFGGIATAINFFEELRKSMNCAARIITVDAPVNSETSVAPEGYCIVNSNEESNEKFQLVAFSDRYEKTIPVAKNDVFVATGWWTAYTIREVMLWQKDMYGTEIHPLIYLVQDYEPGFYAWSSRYMLADSTYRLDVPTWAVVNSSLLREYFEKNDYSFEKVWHFEPVLNAKLGDILKNAPDVVNKKKQIIVYGRPSVERNAFALVVAALQAWCAQQADAEEWTVYSAGEQHDDVDLGKGVFLKSVGKLTIEEYANVMLDTYAGISLMVSPHPSYPPLEMSTFGIKTITNCYGNKDLSSFNENIISLKSAAPVNIAKCLNEICNGYSGKGSVMKQGEYVISTSVFGSIIADLAKDLRRI